MKFLKILGLGFTNFMVLLMLMEVHNRLMLRFLLGFWLLLIIAIIFTFLIGLANKFLYEAFFK